MTQAAGEVAADKSILQMKEHVRIRNKGMKRT